MKNLVFTTWDYTPSKGKALVGGMVKNPSYLFDTINTSEWNKKCITTSKSKGSTTSQETPFIKLETNYFKGIIKYISRSILIANTINKSNTKPDLIHAHTPALAPFFLLNSIPTVITAHGTHWPEFKANHKITNIRNLVKYINASIQFKLEKSIYRKATRVISVSNFQLKELVEDYKIPKEKIVTIENGIDLTQYTASQKPNYEFDIIFVGRPVPKKGIELLLDALESSPSLRSLKTCWIFGQGWVSDPNIQPQIEPRIEKMNGIIINNATEEELVSSLQKSKILVAPSLQYESLPTVILEALACKVVPIASNSFGNREVLPKSLLSQEGDKEDLIQKINDVMNNYEHYKTIASEIDISRFDVKHCARRHEDLYKEIIQ